MKELEVTKEDIELLKEMKDNCLKTNVYDDEKRLLKANTITKFLVLYEKNQKLQTEKEQLNSLVNSCQEEIRRLKSQLKQRDNIINKAKNLYMIIKNNGH